MQLLPLVSSAAAHIMARMREATHIPTVDGSSCGSAAGSSGGTAGSFSRGQPRQGSTNGAQVQQAQLQVELREALVRLSLGVEFLMFGVPFTLAQLIQPPEGPEGVDVPPHSGASNNSTSTSFFSSSLSSPRQGFAGCLAVLSAMPWQHQPDCAAGPGRTRYSSGLGSQAMAP